MIANYHTHTARCRHASGTEEAYVQRALEGGLQVLGFSDHTPYWFPGDYYTHMRMYPQELDLYVNTVRRLQADYASRLEILLGLEVEYYPAYFDDLMARLRDHGIEYILLGQHWSGNEIDEPYNGRASDDVGKLSKYCDQVIAAMETGLFTYLAHPDLIHFTGDGKVYEQHMKRLCQAALDTGTPLEINFMGMREGRHYPNQRFWGVAAELGCPVILGCDSHTPQDAVDPASEQVALEMVKTFGLELLDTVPLKKL